MTAIEKFTFALNFDDADNVIRSSGGEEEYYELGKKKKKKEVEEEDAPPPPPPAIYTEEQAAQMIAEAEQKARDEALAEGHRQGWEQGTQEVMASIEKAVGDVESEIAEKLAQIDEQQKRANAKINEDAIHVAMGVIRKLAPAWSAQHEMVEIEDIVTKCLSNLFDAAKVMVKVNPELETRVREACDRIADSRGFSGKVIVVGEPDIARGDCAVSWGDGTAIRDSARVWSEINAIVDNALAQHAQDHNLAQDDMGDPDIQQSRRPEQAPEPQYQANSAATGESPLGTEASSQNAEDIPAQTDHTNAPSETRHDMPGQTRSLGDQPDAPYPTDAAADQTVTDQQLGDGAPDQNMPTSGPDHMVQSDAETDSAPQHSADSSLLDAQEQSSQATVDDEQFASPSPDATTEPGTGHTPSQPQPETPNGAAADPTDADQTDALRQPSKDAGDTNG
ncbi:hypothetical protein LPB41_20880 [Thalassospira sp. MA62]|nr:hypothetical protein [Thalassospira sp. MA62]